MSKFLYAIINDWEYIITIAKILEVGMYSLTDYLCITCMCYLVYEVVNADKQSPHYI